MAFVPCKGCGKEIEFRKNEKETWTPYTREGTNHFIDCPEANRFHKKKVVA